LPQADESIPEEFSAPLAAGSKQRVQKVLARAGLASRRQAEALIAEGRVRVGGRRIDQQGMLVDPRHDSISVDGRRVAPEPLTYLLFHKPREVMCTMRDPLGRRSVVDYLRGVETRVVPVGRLDYQTSGVLLLTNDGDFARELLHPSRGVLKEYVLKLKGPVDAAGLERLRSRIDIGGKQTKPARIERLRADDNNTWLVVTLQEGKNRQVRRLAEYAGYRVMRLTRTRFAGLATESLRPGEWRQLSAAEVRAVRSHSKTESESADGLRSTSARPGERPRGAAPAPNVAGARPRKLDGARPRKLEGGRLPKGKGGNRGGSKGARRHG
jgi:23S rRNA pseudouridine2605 synthase